MMKINTEHILSIESFYNGEEFVYIFISRISRDSLFTIFIHVLNWRISVNQA